MKYVILNILFFLFFNKIYSQSQLAWVKSIGGSSNESSNCLAVDISGNVFTTGGFTGTSDFDPGTATFSLTAAGSYEDIFISKLDANGNFLWAKQIGGTQGDYGNSIKADLQGNIYVTGYFSSTVDFDPGAGIFSLTSHGLSDIFLMKLDASGNFLWVKQMGSGSFDESYSLVLDNQNNIYITGTFMGTVDFDPGINVFNLNSGPNGNIFACKYNVNGNLLWARSFDGGTYGWTRSITVDDKNNAYITGCFSGTVDFNPGTAVYNLSGYWNAFVCKLDISGNFVWAKQLGGGANDGAYSVAVDGINQDVYITGCFQDTVDFDPGSGSFFMNATGYSDVFILKLNSSGNFVWAKQFVGTGYDGSTPYYMVLDSDRNLHIIGEFSYTVDFDPGPASYSLTSNGLLDIFISTLDSAGNFVCASGIGGTGYDLGLALALDAANNLYVTGWYSTSVDFDPSPNVFNLASAGGFDIFIGKYINCFSALTEITGNSDKEDFARIYPNPSNGIFYLNSASEFTYSVYNSLGQKISFHTVPIKNIEIDLSEYPKGIYFVDLLSETKRSTRKIFTQ